MILCGGDATTIVTTAAALVVYSVVCLVMLVW
jgi:hypothetical protein